MEVYEKKNEKAEGEMHQVYNLILGQCTDAMVARLKQMCKFNEYDTDNNPIGLLNLISNVTLSFSTSTKPIMATWLAKNGNSFIQNKAKGKQTKTTSKGLPRCTT
mmetsp:Transcript_2297/g.3329  ORF Transcript_2297/g.3329 Transcript_2297/m.3329 type:complete len:105 (-) Transcript_2297:3057-3371(-)